MSLVQHSLIAMPSYAFYNLSGKTKAMHYFSDMYQLPIISAPDEISKYKYILFSLISWRDFYTLAALHEHKGSTSWIAGGNACFNPTGVASLVDYVVVGDAFTTFPTLLQGDRSFPGCLDCKNPSAPITPHLEEVFDGAISATEIIASKGCKRKCLFCVNAWRVPYQEGKQITIENFIKNRRGKGVALSSNSFDDISFSASLVDVLKEHNKTNIVVSNSFSGLTDEFTDNRSSEILLGIEGMSSRLRSLMAKPIDRGAYQEKIAKLLSDGKNIRTVYQFNLPSETEEDWNEFYEDVHTITKHTTKETSWAIPLIPNQPSAMTPLQWCGAYYNIAQVERIMKMRKEFSMGKAMNQVKLYIPAPLYPKRWLMQVCAEWIPITMKVVRMFAAIKKDKLEVGQFLLLAKEHGYELSHIFETKAADYVFPWDSYVQYTNRSTLHKAYTTMYDRVEAHRKDK